MREPLRIGLTGGIGSGKSCVAAMFGQLAVPVLDLDREGHEITAPDSEGLAKLIDTFGDSFLNADGSLNRPLLAKHCFSSADETAKLNAIMHPMIWQAEAYWLQSQQTPYVVIEASVLIESGGAERMDGVIVVLADEQLRLKRVLARGDRDEKGFSAIVARQCSDGQRREAATYIIENNGSLQQLKAQVESIHRQILTTL